MAEVCAAGAALETLVNQFSDPLSFYRELIQNSLDAGSRHVDVALTHEQGTMTIEVADAGEGMTEEILDTQLTRLFASSKEGDLTRIGKFGIGFVSVFAIQPRAVVVDTARDGEGWRVVFREDRSFVRAVLPEPLEGTRVRLLKDCTPEEFQDFVRRSLDTVRFWCRHVEGEIRFQGEVINEPFAVDSPHQVRRSLRGTEIVMGCGEPFLGLYNRGLTLVELRGPDALPGLTVKVNSRYLEHTMTRDGVVHDERYERVMGEVLEMAARDLPVHLLDSLEVALRDGGATASLYEALARHFDHAFRRTWTPAELSHRDGEPLDGGWAVHPGRHAPGHATYGPYVTDLPPGFYFARFWLETEPDPRADDRLPVARLEVHEATKGRVNGYLDVRRSDLEGGSRCFPLHFYVEKGQSLEFRTLWEGKVPLWQGPLEVVGGDRRDPTPFRDRVVLRRPGGGDLTLGQVLDAKPLFAASASSALAAAVEEQGGTVALAEPGSPAWLFLQALLQASPSPLERHWCLPRPAAPDREERARALVQAVEALLREQGARLTEVRLAHLGERLPVAGAQGTFGELTATADLRNLGTGLFSRPAALALNADHEALDPLQALATREPELAAWLLVKLYRGPEPDEDAALARAAWEARCRRRSN